MTEPTLDLRAQVVSFIEHRMGMGNALVPSIKAFVQELMEWQRERDANLARTYSHHAADAVLSRAIPE